jgi:hypothetical protein
VNFGGVGDAFSAPGRFRIRIRHRRWGDGVKNGICIRAGSLCSIAVFLKVIAREPRPSGRAAPTD